MLIISLMLLASGKEPQFFLRIVKKKIGFLILKKKLSNPIETKEENRLF